MIFNRSTSAEFNISLGLFGVAALFWSWTASKEKKSTSTATQNGRKDPSVGTGGFKEDISPSTRPVSSRGIKALSPPVPYLKYLLVCFEDQCDPVSNPTGYIALCVAENKLITDMLSQRFMQKSTVTAALSDNAVYCYNNVNGMPVAREAIAYFLAKHFLCTSPTQQAADGKTLTSPNGLLSGTLTLEQALSQIDPKHIALAAGATPILNHLHFLLGEKGQACLVPAPYYAAFENDMNLLAGIEAFPVQLANPVLGPTNAELDIAYEQAMKNGNPPKFVLLTNPNNPLGVIYKPTVLRRIVEWARERKMHTIVDEIYALSTHKKHDHGFESIIKVLNNQLKNDVHMIWGVSKDFGASGLRLGVLYSQNETLLQTFSTVNGFTCVSGPIQYIVSELLTDDVFVEKFLDVSRRRLVANYQVCTAKLKEMVLPFVPAEAGIFVYVDFAALLPRKTYEWEQKLLNLMFEHARIVLTPGESQRDQNPGMFRICYAFVSPEILAMGLERLSRIVAKIRRLGLANLDLSDSRAFKGIL